jgi:hypothetical protein
MVRPLLKLKPDVASHFALRSSNSRTTNAWSTVGSPARPNRCPPVSPAPKRVTSHPLAKSFVKSCGGSQMERLPPNRTLRACLRLRQAVSSDTTSVGWSVNRFRTYSSPTLVELTPYSTSFALVASPSFSVWPTIWFFEAVVPLPHLGKLILDR